MLELTQPDNGMPAGAFYFLDDSIWRSTNAGEYWRLFQTVHNRGSLSTPMRNFPYAPWSPFAKSKPMGANGGFFFQSEVYRRKDGRFLHGARTPVEPGCDDYDGSQLWRSVDTRGKEWECASPAAGGFCDDGNHTCLAIQKGYVDYCNHSESNRGLFLPGSVYSHFLRLHDGRLLLTWTHRTPKYDQDGYGGGTRALVSYDDGDSFDAAHDYIVLSAQNDSLNAFCLTGCGCRDGYGNTIQLPNGTLVSVYCHDGPAEATPAHRNAVVGIVRWSLPKPKTDDSELGRVDKLWFSFYDLYLDAAKYGNCSSPTASKDPPCPDFRQAASFVNLPTVDASDEAQLDFRAHQWAALGGSQAALWRVPSMGLWQDPAKHGGCIDPLCRTVVSGLVEDWEARLRSGIASVKSALAKTKGTAPDPFFFLGDEIVGSCVPVANLTTVARRLKQAFGPRTKIYTNEDTLPFTPSGSSCAAAQRCASADPAATEAYCLHRGVPSEIDLISVDDYASRNSSASAQAREADDVLAWYTSHIYPALSPRQSVFFVPGLYGPRVDDATDELLVRKFERYWELASSEKRVSGLKPFHFDPDYKFRLRPRGYWAKYGAAAYPKLMRAMARSADTAREARVAAAPGVAGSVQRRPESRLWPKLRAIRGWAFAYNLTNETLYPPGTINLYATVNPQGASWDTKYGIAGYAALEQSQQLAARGVLPLIWEYCWQSPNADKVDHGRNKTAVVEYFTRWTFPYPWAAGTGVDECNLGEVAFKGERELAAQGLRQAKRSNPDKFLAAWGGMKGDELFASLMADGTFDLALVEGYTYCAEAHGDWPAKADTCANGGTAEVEQYFGRLDFARARGYLNRTVFSYGTRPFLRSVHSTRGLIDRRLKHQTVRGGAQLTLLSPRHHLLRPLAFYTQGALHDEFVLS